VNERQSVIAELDDLWRQIVESRRPVCTERLGGADDDVAVVESLLVPVDSEETGTRAWVGQYGVLTPGRRIVDVPLFPQRALAPVSTFTDEPL